MNARRLEAVRQGVKTLQLDALLVTFVPHVRYLTGFSGSNALVFVTSRQQWFFTDGRYTTQSREEVKGFRRVITGRNLFQELRDTVRIPSRTRVGIDRRHLSVIELENLKSLFPRVKFAPADLLVDSCAAVKDASEIDMIRKAISISENVFLKILGIIKAGISELEIAAEIASLHRRFGADADAFEPIVASGPRGALPHARASAKKIAKGELVTIDFGCRVAGYNSDITRTVAVGKINAEKRRMYKVVQDAQELAVNASRAGMRGKELDAVARSYIKNQKFGKYFTHSLGHGLGLQVHENPRVSALSDDLLAPGNVITIEPGVYVPGVGGVRIEDDIVVRDGGNQVLTTLPKELLTL